MIIINYTQNSQNCNPFIIIKKISINVYTFTSKCFNEILHLYNSCFHDIEMTNE